MKKIGLIYGATATQTTHVAQLIEAAWGAEEIETIAVETAWADDFRAHDRLIVGASTWFDGELPTYWDELMPELSTLDLSGKRVALFGLGNQAGYPDNFADGLGLLADTLEAAGATLVGFTSIDGYHFMHSRAQRKEQFCGLIIDPDNQAELTQERVKAWCEQLKGEL